MTADAKIREVLGRYDVPYQGNVWAVQGTPVIRHMALEMVAAKAGIIFDAPTILRAERDEAVMLVIGTLGERREWSVGECLVNVNYKVTGKQAAYPYAMAEKRAKDRVILKLVSLHGLAYSEEEADDFKRAPQSRNDDPPAPMPVDQMMHEVGICETHEDLALLKADPAFRSGYRAADEVSRKRIEGALSKASEECAA